MQQREGAVDAGVRADDGRDRERDVLDAAHVVAGAIKIVEPFGNCHLAGAGRLEGEQRERVELAQRDVAGQLQFALVVVVVRHLHPLDVQIERLAGEQALAPAVPVVELHEILGVQFGAHQLLLHRPLGLARGVEGEPVVLVVEPRNLALHPQVEIFVGELVVEELIHLLRVRDLLSGCSDIRDGRSVRR